MFDFFTQLWTVADCLALPMGTLILEEPHLGLLCDMPAIQAFVWLETCLVCAKQMDIGQENLPSATVRVHFIKK